ncbi:MAG: PAS domain S-box protein [Mariniphaga sp.]
MKEKEKANRIILRPKAEELLKMRKGTESVISAAEGDMLKLIHELKVYQIELELQNEELALSKQHEEFAREKYTNLFDFAPSAYFTLTASGAISELNLTAAKMLCKERRNLINQKFTLFITYGSQNAFSEFFSKTLSSKNLQSCEVAFETIGGMPLYAHLNGTLADDGIHCLITAVDISERRQAQLALQKSEERFRQLAETSTILVYRILLKPEFKFEYVSPSATAITGYAPEDHYNDPQLGFKLVHPDDRILLENTKRYSKGEPLVLRWIRKDGRIIWTEQHNVLLFDNNKEPYAIEGNARDITDSKNIELGLRKDAERNSLLLGLFTNAPVLTDTELFDEVLDIAVKITDSEIGFFHQVSDNQQEIILTTWNDEAKKNCTIVYDNHYPMQSAGNWADCVRLKEAVVYNDYAASPNKKGLPEGHPPIGRTLSVPVVDSEKVRLIFGVGNKSSDYNDSDVVQIQTIANEMHKILEKRKIEKELQKSEERWHFAIEGSNDGIWDWNVFTGDVYFSNRWKEMIGYATAELEGKLSEWQTRVHPDDIEGVTFKLQQHFNREAPDYSSEHRILCKDGSWKWILDRGKVLEWNSDGKPVRMVGTHTDITDRKKTEEKIRESGEKYRSIFESVQEVYFEASIDGTLLEVSPSIEKISNGQFTRNEMIGKSFAGIFANPVGRNVYFSKLFEHKRVNDFELSLLNKDGSVIPVAISSVLSFDENGNPVKITGILRDIAERKDAENKLNETLRKLSETNVHLENRVEERTLELRQLSNLQQAILRHAGLAIISTSTEGLIEQFNDAAEEMLGYKANEVVGKNTPVLFHEPQELVKRARELSLETSENIPSDFSVFQTILKGSLNQTGEWTYVRKGGEKFPAKLTLSSIKDQDGRLLGYIGLAIDITKEKQSISALRESEERFHNMFWDHSAVMILVDPENGEIIEANKAAEQFYGIPFNKGPRLLVSDLNTLSSDQIKEEMEKAGLQKHNYFIFPHKLANGEIRTVEVHSSPIDVKGSKVLFSVIHDITERKKLYQELADEKRRLADIIKGTNVGTWEWNVQTGETRFNEQWANMIGYTLDEISPISIETWMRFSHPDDLKKSGELLEEHFKGELDYYSFESRMKHKNGNWIWVLDRGRVHDWDSKGKPFLMSGTHQDITERKMAEEKLQWNKSFLELMSNSSPLGFLVVDNRNDEILFFNHRFCQIWEIEQLKDQLTLGKLKNNDIIPNCLAVLADIPAFAESCKPLQDESNRIVVEDEIAFTENRTVRRFTTQIRGENDEYFGRFYIFEDITKRKRVELDLKKARNEAEKANLAKSEFLSRMSHELRTPMNSILGFAQLMDMGELNSKQKKGIKHIINNGRHLLSLINDVLDISGIEAGRQILAYEPVQLAAIINEITDSIQIAANKRKVSIVLVDSSANSLFALADKLRLKQILINLLNNAIKYNNEGGSVTINTAVQPTNESGECPVRISICDTGNGISPEDIGKLFQPFERIGAVQNETEGTGLGLVVVKKLIEVMDGKVGVESIVGRGSTFWIELPITNHSKQDILQTNGSPTPGLQETKHGTTILYIEDNPSNIELVEAIMEQHRPEISLVTSMHGKQTLPLAKEYRPDLIMLDLNLPDVPGIDVLEQLLADDHTKAIPVIIISADAMPFQIEKLIKAGATDYLTKPLDIVQFLKTIEQYLKN